MNRNIILIILILASGLNLSGQGTVNFLQEVSANHSVLKSYAGRLEVSRAESVTGNTPDDFGIGYGYFPGTPDAIGVKQTISATQSFEFPTNYVRRGKLNREALARDETGYELERIGTLLEARNAAYRYICLKARIEVLEEKAASYAMLKTGWTAMLNDGAVTRQDYNRINIELSIARSEIDALLAEMNAIRSKLDYMSGGQGFLLDSTGYDIFPEPDLQALDSIKRAIHPAFLLYDREYAVSLQQLSLSRSDNLPDIDVGFGSEIIAGQHYTGPSVGLSIPLWANRNEVKLASAKSSAIAIERDAAHSSLRSELEIQFEYYTLVKQNYSGMKENYSAFGDIAGLDEALKEKEITISEYISYMESVYDIREMIINLDKDYHTALASLFDYMLADLK